MEDFGCKLKESGLYPVSNRNSQKVSKPGSGTTWPVLGKVSGGKESDRMQSQEIQVRDHVTNWH